MFMAPQRTARGIFIRPVRVINRHMTLLDQCQVTHLCRKTGPDHGVGNGPGHSLAIAIIGHAAIIPTIKSFCITHHPFFRTGRQNRRPALVIIRRKDPPLRRDKPAGPSSWPRETVLRYPRSRPESRDSASRYYYAKRLAPHRLPLRIGRARSPRSRSTRRSMMKFCASSAHRKTGPSVPGAS
jgi:hypothetical protein